MNIISKKVSKYTKSFKVQNTVVSANGQI